MLCTIYRSKKKPGSYLYIQKRDDFSSVPDALLTHFGKPELVMMFNLAGNKLLHNADKNEVREKIESQGFYLQMSKQDDGLFNSLSEIK
ncbi:YcgL domain-containing protein [Rodentibacter haemolyticus]|uniref:YcgL domain-containing protein IHV77_11485 n=1 Tax=Rodentibacter haemolyticus TaxID=2778911 RepID=A0ABX6UZH8_9PAST|nr:YcgL domain-containing protein [Rodentibacter haemolyticus]QPB42496.1 YcgL domain-containing protein [Rodentibacter haemolyticus]